MFSVEDRAFVIINIFFLEWQYTMDYYMAEKVKVRQSWSGSEKVQWKKWRLVHYIINVVSYSFCLVQWSDMETC